MVTVILWGIVAYFIGYAFIMKTKNIPSSMLFKILPFFSAFYIALSLYNPHEIYIPFVYLGIGIFFIIKGFIIDASSNFASKLVFKIIPILSGVALILKCLRDINLI